MGAADPEQGREPSPKKRKAAAAAAASLSLEAYLEQGLIAGEKVCIISRTSLDECIDDYVDYFHIYIVDLDVDDSAHRGFRPAFRPPTLRIGPDCLDADYFCVLDSTLYIFESLESMTADPCKHVSVFRYKLPPSSVSNLRLQRHMLDKIPDMHDSKFFPIVIPTPDGKRFLVFSSRFDKLPYNRPRPADGPSDCEIYDPVGDGGTGGSWYRLPRIPIDSARVGAFFIIGHAFIDNNVLILHTNTSMKLTLDLGSPHRPWQIVYVSNDFNYSILVGRLHFTPMLAYENDNEDCFGFPGLSSLFLNRSHKRRNITLLHTDNSECKFCIVQYEIDNKAALRPCLTVNVYKLDQEVYEKEKGKILEETPRKMKWDSERPPLPGIRISKSFKFRLNLQAMDNSFDRLFLFSIPAIGN